MMMVVCTGVYDASNSRNKQVIKRKIGVGENDVIQEAQVIVDDGEKAAKR